jgi:hypothetical protein
MTSDLLFVYGTLMRDFDHPMARMLSRNADFQTTSSAMTVKMVPGPCE